MSLSVNMPARILDKHVGGNTTYARELAFGLEARGVSIGRIQAGKNPYQTLFSETLAGLRSSGGSEVLHYVADTGPLVKTRTPSVVTVHGVASRWINTARNARQEMIWRLRVSRAIRSCDAVVTVSNSSADDIAETFGVEREGISVIHHGIRTEKFSDPAQLGSELIKRLPSTYALYLGNIEPRKNLVALIDAFESPAMRSLGIPLVVAGRPAWNYQESMRRIESSDRVIYLGFVSDEERVALMQQCHLFVFPSLYEGFGFPVLEAMAAGAVVLTTSEGSLAEVAGPALRFKGTDSESLRIGLESGLSDEAVRIGSQRQGHDWVHRFNWDDAVEKHMQVYKKVCL